MLGDVPTPALVVDVAVLERNLAEMANAAARAGLALRPHAKTHKCLPIARRQLELGAAGLSVATLGEAEVFAGDGVTDLFVAFPVWADDDRAGRLLALGEQCRLRVGVDSVAGVEALGRVGGRGAAPFEVLVEVDCGQHRSGVVPSEVPLVALAAEQAGLPVVGVFTFPGHAYGPGAPDQAAADELTALGEARSRLADHALAVDVISGGSTPTAMRSVADPSELTELRPGVYVFNDAQQVRLGTCGLDRVALSAVSTVVSAPAPGRFVLDAGSKVLGADRPAWVDGHGIVPEYPGALVESLSEHHAVVTLSSADARPPKAGDRVHVVPNHVCSAVNLVDELLVVDGDVVVDRWPVAARGANN